MPCDDSHLTPQRLRDIERKYAHVYEEYKVRRLNEMACRWKGKVHEPYTVPLLAMLLQENTALDPEVLGDHGYSIGISQWHICYRGFRGKKYCNTAAKVDFYDKYDWFRRDLWAQFNFYSDHIKKLIAEGYSADDIIVSWNPKEHNRLWRVKRWNELVEMSVK